MPHPRLKAPPQPLDILEKISLKNKKAPFNPHEVWASRGGQWPTNLSLSAIRSILNRYAYKLFPEARLFNEFRDTGRAELDDACPGDFIHTTNPQQLMRVFNLLIHLTDCRIVAFEANLALDEDGMPIADSCIGAKTALERINECSPSLIHDPHSLLNRIRKGTLKMTWRKYRLLIRRLSEQLLWDQEQLDKWLFMDRPELGGGFFIPFNALDLFKSEPNRERAKVENLIAVQLLCRMLDAEHHSSLEFPIPEYAIPAYDLAYFDRICEHGFDDPDDLPIEGPPVLAGPVMPKLYAQIEPGHPEYELMNLQLKKGLKFCDAIDHDNKASGCPNPDCVRHRRRAA